MRYHVLKLHCGRPAPRTSSNGPQGLRNRPSRAKRSSGRRAPNSRHDRPSRQTSPTGVLLSGSNSAWPPTTPGSSTRTARTTTAEATTMRQGSVSGTPVATSRTAVPRRQAHRRENGRKAVLRNREAPGDGRLVSRRDGGDHHADAGHTRELRHSTVSIRSVNGCQLTAATRTRLPNASVPATVRQPLIVASKSSTAFIL
jgi:hypothetical protein